MQEIGIQNSLRIILPSVGIFDLLFLVIPKSINQSHQQSGLGLSQHFGITTSETGLLVGFVDNKELKHV